MYTVTENTSSNDISKDNNIIIISNPTTAGTPAEFFG